MKFSLHALHALPANLLNRGDDGEPKTIKIGGTLRLRNSSQSWKRDMRSYNRANGAGDLTHAMRTQELPKLIIDALVELGHDRDEAVAKVYEVMKSRGLKVNDSGKTAVMLFLPEGAEERVAKVISEDWDEIQIGKGAPEATVERVTNQFDENRNLDLALYGRFLAEVSGSTIDGALCLAHPMGVDELNVVSDFFTAVEDRGDSERTTSGMMGSVPLTSGIFYRYAALDLDMLAKRYEGDMDAVRTTVQAVTDAFTNAMPQAKRTSTAAFTSPSIVMSVLGRRPVYLADAFTKAVRYNPAEPERDTMTIAIERLLHAHDRSVRRNPRVYEGNGLLLPLGVDETSLPSTVADVVETVEDLAGSVK
ncbi:type I-E CRISPR-associated protein Cas7/Cse4/CasC [Kitasatospora sp. NPDC056076]|uniref:type I-E CRISPR-associated protein Cas7/Cse4/CasC n=1 Tax=Kitasatospora sp. NPDC056076 TaxID=3345703 RepID=UPI0035DDE5BF